MSVVSMLPSTQQQKSFDIPLTQVEVITSQQSEELTQNIEETQPFHEKDKEDQDPVRDDEKKDEEEQQSPEDQDPVRDDEKKDEEEQQSPDQDRVRDDEEEQLPPTQIFTDSSDDEETSKNSTYKVGDRVQVHYKKVMYLNAEIHKVFIYIY